MVVASKAPHPAQAPSPCGGLDMLRLGCPTHGRVRGDARRPLVRKEGDKRWQERAGIRQLASHRLTQLEVLLEGLAQEPIPHLLAKATPARKAG